MVLCDISLLGRCWGTSRFTDVQPIFLDVDVYKWMLSSIPIEVEEYYGIRNTDGTFGLQMVGTIRNTIIR